MATMTAPRRLRLLSLDGGGVRGLSSLYILKEIMWKVGYGSSPTDEHPSDHERAIPKPCEYFDLIGGTSTGGLIAIMLGRLEMTIDECIAVYLRLSREIFSSPRRDRSSRIDKYMKKVSAIAGREIKANFDAFAFEAIIEDVLKQRGLAEDALLKSPSKCKVFVCAVSDANSQPTCFKSYTTSDNDEFINHTTILQACRATSAAKTFFDPIKIGSETFSDGGIRYNNPVRQVWAEAARLQRMPASELHRSILCLVSIGTGVPNFPKEADAKLQDVLKLLQQIATDTEATATAFVEEQSALYQRQQYFRFDVSRGLQGIKLDEAEKNHIIAASTRAYLKDETVRVKAQICADVLSERTRRRLNTIASTDPFRIPFDTRNMAIIHDKFVARPEMERIENTLLQCSREDQRQVFVLSGMGGIGKTQLATEFCRKHHTSFSAVLWLKGNTRDDVLRSLIRYASLIDPNQITQRAVPTTKAEEEAIAGDVLKWLAQEDNSNWLLVFDNVDLNYKVACDAKQGAYNVTEFMPGDHGAVLITTRRERLQQLGSGERLGSVSDELSRMIFDRWYGVDSEIESPLANSGTEASLLIENLAGLPLAIAQAAVYIRETLISITEYLALWAEHWNEVSGTFEEESSLEAYHTPIGITWNISLERVRKIKRYGESAYHLICIWAFLDNRDFWHGMLDDLLIDTGGYYSIPDPEGLDFQEWKTRYGWHDLPEWQLELCQSKAAFLGTMRILSDYCLIEKGESPGGDDTYSMHAVVHKWALHRQSPSDQGASLSTAIALFYTKERWMSAPWSVKQRWLPHGDKCFAWLVSRPDRKLVLEAIGISLRSIAGAIGLAWFYADLIRPKEAVLLCESLNKLLDSDGGLIRTSLPRTVQHSLESTRASTYQIMGGWPAAKSGFRRTLQLSTEMWGDDHHMTLADKCNLAGSCIRCGSKKAAASCESMLIEIVEIVDALDTSLRNGSMDALRAAATALLGCLYYRTGNHRASEEKLLESLESYNIMNGPWAVLYGVALRTLGKIRLQAHRYQDAAEILEQSYHRSNSEYGPKHHGRIHVAALLGKACIGMGQLDRAEEKLREALTAPYLHTTLKAMNSLLDLSSKLQETGDGQRSLIILQLAWQHFVYGCAPILMKLHLQKRIPWALRTARRLYCRLHRRYQITERHDLSQALEKERNSCPLPDGWWQELDGEDVDRSSSSEMDEEFPAEDSSEGSDTDSGWEAIAEGDKDRDQDAEGGH